MKQHIFLFVIAIVLATTNTIESQCLSVDDNVGPRPEESANLLSKASLRYTANQMKELSKLNPGQNIFISPYSIWSALTLAYFGAKGETERELAQVLGFGQLDKTTVGKGYLKIKKDLQDSETSGKSTLAIATKVIFDDEIKIRECMVNKFFDELARVNFSRNPRESIDRINYWVESRTENKIKNLIPDGGITSLTKLVILNAVYFKGKWFYAFDESATSKQPFRLASGETRLVDMMKLKAELFYGEDPTIGARLVELPYENGNFSMVVMLPMGSNTVEDVVSKITAQNLDNAINQMSGINAELQMPKFNIEDGYDMAEVLSKMGIEKLFSNADLTGYTRQKIEVSSVVHKAVVEVNEQGTEAAGATAVIMSRTSRILGDISLTIDSPFIFLIKDNRQDIPLFMGVINELDGQPIRRNLRSF